MGAHTLATGVGSIGLTTDGTITPGWGSYSIAPLYQYHTMSESLNDQSKNSKQEVEGMRFSTFTFKVNGKCYTVQEDLVVQGLGMNRVLEVSGYPKETDLYTRSSKGLTRLVKISKSKHFVFNDGSCPEFFTLGKMEYNS